MLLWRYWAILVWGYWWCPVTLNTEWSSELMRKKFIPALSLKWGVEMYSAGWSNTVLLQRFTPITPPLLPWRQAGLVSYGTPLVCTFSRPIPFQLYLLRGYLKDRVYGNNPQTIGAWITFEQRSEFPIKILDKVITNLNMQGATMVMCQAD